MSGLWCFNKFNNALVLLDDEPPMIKGSLKYDQGCKANLGSLLCWLIDDNFFLSVKIWLAFLVIVITLI